MSGGDETLVRMPKLADTLVEGTLGQWLKQVGDAVARAEPLATIETDKVTTELTSPAAGTLLELLVPEGQTVAIDTPIARIGSQARSAGTPLPTAAPSATSLLLSVPASVAPPSAESASPTPPSAVDPQAAAASAALPSGAPPSSGFASAAARSVVRMTPVAARVLAEHGLSASGVPAPSGRLTKHDVLSYLGRLHESLPLAPSATQEAKGSRGVGESVAPP
ncbi:MAG: biotin/lipoyl-containing protein, partial [Chloroflexota bacterium]